VRVVCIVIPAGCRIALAPPLQLRSGMKDFETLDHDQLLSANGGLAMDPAARWIMQHESGGDPHAGHLYAQGRGDGTRGNHSSAYGAFQMINSTRKQYMGSNYQSGDLGAQYAAASHYVRDRYGSWGAAKRFWQAHRWY
jgi:hypothetical protein